MATVELKLKPFNVPAFAHVDLPEREGKTSLSPAIPIAELSEDAIEDLAMEWLEALYANRGKRCPFRRPARSMDKAA